MIERLLVERKGVERKAPEETLALAWATRVGLPNEAIGQRALAHAGVGPQTLCVGTVAFVRAALQAAGEKLPTHAPYPEVLRPWLHRRTGFSPALRDLVRTAQFPLFVKPADGWKRFTGLVLDHGDALREHRIGRHQAVFWSDPVVWCSEWRAYVVAGQVLNLQPCPGTTLADPRPDGQAIAQAAQALHLAGGPSGLVMDFGVLDSGETALVEANDGFAFGAYGSVGEKTLGAVWSARWPELFGKNGAALALSQNLEPVDA